jgi:hypothetical protein
MSRPLRRGRPARAALALALVLATLSACDRSPRFKAAPADTTAMVPSDSNSTYVQMARLRWDDPEQGAEAADLTARVLLQDLRNHPGQPIYDRARALLDSLSFGVETGGGSSFVLTNLFARSNPSAGSYPYLFWREAGATHSQSLEAGGMHLIGAIAEPAGQSGTPGTRIAALFSRVSSSGQQPFVFVWQHPPGGASWRLVQSLGADSLGSIGSARLGYPDANGVVLVSRATMPARGFDECLTCSHVNRVRSFRWGEPGLVLAQEDIERTPYYTFVQLIQALVANDRAGAGNWVADPSLIDTALGAGWGLTKGLWRLAPGTPPTDRDLVLFRGQQEAYRVHFAPRGPDWIVTGFEPTTRSVE